MHRIYAAIFAFIISLACTLHGQINGPGGEGQFPPARVPNSAEQAKVDRVLREKYKTEFASRDPGERGALAKKFREAAGKENDPIAKFVYLREARDLAVDAGDFSLSLDIIDALAEAFPINAPEMKANALAAGVDRARLSPDDLARAYIQCADDLLDKWDTDLAHKSAYLAWKLSTKNAELHQTATQRDTLAKLRGHEIVQAYAAAQKLAKDPEDASANQILGRHLCFNRNNWPAGLPYLVKSESSNLKALAQADSADPKDTDAMNALAGKWWEFSDPKVNLPAGGARRRAAFWYAKALAGLTGDKKDVAEKRIAEAAPAAK